jgi:predicted nucleic acid-binding protein
MPLLLDTGIVYALADADDAWHARARDYLSAHPDVLLVPITVVPEITYLLHARLGSAAERRFVAAVAAGEVAVENLTPADLRRCVSLLERYPKVGFVDASVVAVAERLRLRTIATTDHRDFTLMRPAHLPAFELVP